MQATFTKSDFYNIKESAYKARDNQALLHQYSVIAETENGIRELVIARFYASLRRGANRVTCILWTNGGHNANASGYNETYGLHRGSAALADAIRNAGIVLSENISGCGDDAVRDALLAIARADCPDAKILGVFEAHN